MEICKGYEAVIGIEAHVELKTEKKTFCDCINRFGLVSDSSTCPICLGKPGALPHLNFEAVEKAVTAGMALGCRIREVSSFDRKHYFYPDLPKGYQITQYYEPICYDGKVEFILDGVKKAVRIERIHIEEDAGKLSYFEGQVICDHNRCGVPLVEIVTCPDIRSPEEAEAFARELRARLYYAGVSDCRMNEGSLRCDLNISLRRQGEETLRERCEIKNINSFHFIFAAAEAEIRRQAEIYEKGGRVKSETRRFNEITKETEFMREKETPAVYRYIKEPDIPPIKLEKSLIDSIGRSLSVMPHEMKDRFMSSGLTLQESEIICEEKETALYFEKVLSLSDGRYARTCASLYIGEILKNDSLKDKTSLRPEYLAECAELQEKRKVNSASARKLVVLAYENDKSPSLIADEKSLFLIADPEIIKPFLGRGETEIPAVYADIRKGKDKAKKVAVGYLMKKTGGRADPLLLEKMVNEYFS